MQLVVLVLMHLLVLKVKHILEMVVMVEDLDMHIQKETPMVALVSSSSLILSLIHI